MENTSENNSNILFTRVIECNEELNELLNDNNIDTNIHSSISDEVELVEMLKSLITDPSTDPIIDNGMGNNGMGKIYGNDIIHRVESPITVPIELLSPKFTFIQLINNIIHSENIQREKNISCSTDICFLIQYMINVEPDFFISIESAFINIVIQNKININDIPNIISSLIKLYVSLCTVYKNVNLGEQCGKILKIVYTILIQEKIIQIDNADEVLIFLHKLIDSCVELLTLHNKMKSGKNTFSIFNFGLGCTTNY
jgi:hypothetical protein